MNSKKVLVIGLDSAPPEIVFDEFYDQLPNIREMIDHGTSAKLMSCHPPITIPAWLVMLTGKSPGRLGLYGFRHRKGYSYDEGWIASSRSVRGNKLWDILGINGKKVCLVGIPPTYPPVPVEGNLVSCFITPDANREFTYPSQLKYEIQDLIGNYMFDVTFRTEDRDSLLKQIYAMTEQHFTVVRHMLVKKEWDFFMFVEIGIDRIHHAFWKFFDRQHEKYVPGNKYEDVIRQYYKFVDEKIGEILSLIDDDTVVITTSDHGAKRMRGAFCINEWLIQEGYLSLKHRPNSIIDLDKAEVDWQKTKAWGWGGYYARIFLNVKGREEKGFIDQRDYESERDELTKRLEQIRDPKGRVMDTKVFKPEELYSVSLGDKPDLMVYFDDLYWRSAGTIGHNSLYLSENDTGPDDAVHSQEGIFVMYDPRGKKKRLDRINIMDITPIILDIMDIPIPEDVEGRIPRELLG
ncbi:MAG: alkaline phosphatase family protein [Nitrososphaerales archaeon]|nr:alkaline phosphatase family protein [Nitrososphaerales archaeon]